MRRLLAIALVPGLLPCMLPNAHAAACTGASPFGDIAQNAIYCSDAVWASNAGIALGFAGGNFQPNDSVTRAQMVLFLRRTAEATFPAAILTESAAAPTGDLDGAGGVVSCTTAAIPHPGNNEHLAHAVAVVSLLGGAASADVQLAVSRSAGGGPFVPIGTTRPVITVAPGQWANASVMADAVTMAAGVPSQWRIDLARATGSASTGELAGMRCQLRVYRSMSPLPPA